jgi:hypothetical protein
VYPEHFLNKSMTNLPKNICLDEAEVTYYISFPHFMIISLLMSNKPIHYRVNSIDQNAG